MKNAKPSVIFMMTSALVLISISCATTRYYIGAVRPNSQARNEIIMTEDLKALLRETPKPKVVIRVPSPPTNVTEAERFNTYINTIEKVLIQNGFEVRDRALLENLLRSGNADYQTIGQRIDTDLIIDVLSLQFDIANKQRTFFNKTLGLEDRFLLEANSVDCPLARLECRLTIVKKGLLGGMFTFNISRCDYGDIDFVFDVQNKLLGWVENKTGPQYAELNAPFEKEEIKIAVTQWMAQNLIYQLGFSLREGFETAVQQYNQHRYPEALAGFEKLISKDPKNYDYYLFAGMIYARMSNFEKAAQMLENARATAATDAAKASVSYSYANFYALRGDVEMAFSFLRKALNEGYKEFDHIRTDEDLALVRNDPRFKDLLAPYEGGGTAPKGKAGNPKKK